MSEKENILTYVDDEGKEVMCEILFTFESEEFKKNYVLFYPIEEKGEESIDVMAASFNPLEDGSVGELNEITTEEEWELVEEMLDSFSDDCDCEECNDECDEHHCHCCSDDEE